MTFPGHAQGRFAPGLRDWPTALAVGHHLLLSHGLAVHGARPASVGITLNLSPVYPAGARRGGGRAALRRPPQPLVPGPGAARRLPEDVLEHYERRVGPIDAIRDGDLEVIARPIDFLGVNYYFPSRVRADSDDEPLGVALRTRARRR